jgi:hypothetical protein
MSSFEIGRERDETEDREEEKEREEAETEASEMENDPFSDDEKEAIGDNSDSNEDDTTDI